MKKDGKSKGNTKEMSQKTTDSSTEVEISR